VNADSAIKYNLTGYHINKNNTSEPDDQEEFIVIIIS